MAFIGHIKPQVDFVINPQCISQTDHFSDDSSMKSPLGIYITERKKALKVTQDWIAEKLDVSSNAVSKWVKTGKISRENFFALVSLIGKEGAPYLDDVIDGESRRIDKNLEIGHKSASTVRLPAPPTATDELMKIACVISEEGMRALLEFARHIEKAHPKAKQTQSSTG